MSTTLEIQSVRPKMRLFAHLVLLLACGATCAATVPESVGSASEYLQPSVQLVMGEAPKQVRTFRNNDEQRVRFDVVQSLYIVTFANDGADSIEFEPVITYTEINIPKPDLSGQAFVRCGDMTWTPRRRVHKDWDPGCEPLALAPGDSLMMTFAHSIPDYLPWRREIEVEVRLLVPPRCNPDKPWELMSFVALRDTVSVWF